MCVCVCKTGQQGRKCLRMTSEFQELKTRYLTHYISALSGQKEPHKFCEIFHRKPSLEIYLKEKCSSDHYQQLSFQYFAKSFLISRLLSKVSEKQTTILRVMAKWCTSSVW